MTEVGETPMREGGDVSAAGCFLAVKDLMGTVDPNPGCKTFELAPLRVRVATEKSLLPSISIGCQV